MAVVEEGGGGYPLPDIILAGVKSDRSLMR